MTTKATELFKNFASPFLTIALIIVGILLLISLFIDNRLNTIVMFIFGVFNFFLFSAVFRELIEVETVTDEAINFASVFVAVVCGIWFFGRHIPIAVPTYEYVGTYLILGTLIDLFENKGVGFLAILISSGLVGTGAYFLSNYLFVSGLFWIPCFVYPGVQVLSCVIGFVKSFVSDT